MAENNVGTQAKLEAHSLQHYNETGVINTMYAFRDGILRFTDLSDKIVEVERRLCSYWDGIAHQEFHERFQRVFCQVRNLGSALGDIYDMLNEAQLTFYETDDGFDQQLREAIHNTAKGGSESSGTDKALRDVTPRVMPDVYTPNLTYTPLPAKPVLVRMHALSPFADVFGETGSRGHLLARSMEIIAEEGTGVVVVINRPRSDAFTTAVRLKAGEEVSIDMEELRDYGVGAMILAELGVQDMVLLTNTHHTLVGLDGYGLSIVGEREITGLEKITGLGN